MFCFAVKYSEKLGYSLNIVLWDNLQSSTVNND